MTSSCGVQVSPTSSLRPPTEFSYIAVIGGRLNVSEPIDAETERYLKQASALGVPVLGVCTGSFILAQAGLLDDRLSCVSWLHYGEFKERFPNLSVTSQRIFVEDRNIMTCAGGSSVADLATFLLRRHVGPEAERNALEILQIVRRRDSDELQPRDPLDFGGIRDERVSRSLMLMEQRIEEVLDIAAVADKIGLSRRQLERLFQKELNATPAAIYQVLRLKTAMRLVAGTDMPLIDIAIQTGFENSSHFIRRFKKAFAVTPTSVRRQGEQQRQEWAKRSMPQLQGRTEART
ncbi:GlxA family transcriptional regulator [Agrobacterium sp. ES01]|uniref:GlxA family transcriptional regulator n=1 Tax=Agrobacterium sp. ES01 TaxID=3420714 RepID=UPI003D0FE41A